MKHYFALILSWFLFAFWGVISREASLPIPVLLLLTTLFGFIFTLLFRQSKFITWNKTAFIVSIILVFDLLFLLIGFRYVNFTTVITLHYFAPVIVMLFSHYVLNEKTTKHDFIFSIIGFIGVIALFAHELTLEISFLHMLGLISSLLSSVTLAGNILYQRLYMKEEGNYVMAVRQYNSYMFIIFLCVIFPIWIIYSFEENVLILVQSLTFKNILMAIISGLMIQGVAMILFNSSARFIQAKTIAKMAYTEVLWVVLFGFLIYNENLHVLQIIGMVLVFFVAFGVVKYEK
jgi:drug/metabolite transporter (DMT)-like permease